MTLLVGVSRGLLSSDIEAPVEISYLADSVILLRYFEVKGAVRMAISVLKKRVGGHERTIREFGLGEGGIRIGEPLQGLRGVLTGVPHEASPEGDP